MLYSVMAREGERISVEVESVRLGTLHFSNGENDLTVTIFDSAGHEVASADDSAMYVQDPSLSVVSARSDRYFVEISQKLYQSPRQTWYRVHIGNFTRPMGIYPAGGQAGQKLSVRVLGDPAGERTETVSLPKDPGNFDYFSGPPGQQPPSPNVLCVSPYPNVMKAEGKGPTNVPTLPAALNGIYSTKGSTRRVQLFRKEKRRHGGSVYTREPWVRQWIRKIWIRAANNPKDLMSVDDSKMAELGYVSTRGSWFIKDMLDPVGIFKAPADGQYTLGIEDTRGSAGPDYIYRIGIEPVEDTLYTHITSPDGYQIPRLVGLIVPQGGRWTLNVQIAPGIGNNYKDEVELEAVGLPRGVKMIAPRFLKGSTRMPVQFIADADAEQQSALIQLLARPVNRAMPLKTQSQQGFVGILFNRPNEYPWHVVFLDRFALAVTQPAPFDLELEGPQLSLPKNGEMELKVKVNRHAGFSRSGSGASERTGCRPIASLEFPLITIPADQTEGSAIRFSRTIKQRRVLIRSP